MGKSMPRTAPPRMPSIRAARFEVTMGSSNPATVSTDYYTSDHLFFEPLTVEDVLNIHDRMKPEGVIVQFGGQTPLKLAKPLEAAGVPIIGTSVDSIDIAENRKRFAVLVDEIGLRQPANSTAVDAPAAVFAARKIGFPVLVRPSFVLGGRDMKIVYTEDELEAMDEASNDDEETPAGLELRDKLLACMPATT